MKTLLVIIIAIYTTAALSCINRPLTVSVKESGVQYEMFLQDGKVTSNEDITLKMAPNAKPGFTTSWNVILTEYKVKIGSLHLFETDNDYIWNLFGPDSMSDKQEVKVYIFSKNENLRSLRPPVSMNLLNDNISENEIEVIDGVRRISCGE
jgi:hypothetical protein